MAFPTRSTKVSLAFAFENAMQIAADIKAEATALRTVVSNGPVSANALLEFVQHIEGYARQLSRIAALPGLGAYAKAQLNDSTFDMAAEYSAIRARMDAAVSWIVGAMPKSPNGFVEKDKLNPDGSVSVRSFTPVETSGLVTKLDDLIASIG